MNIKFFLIFWLVFSYVVGVFVVSQTSNQDIRLSTIEYEFPKFEKKYPEDTQIYEAKIPDKYVNTSDLAELLKQFDSFNNFFPLSIITRLNLTISSPLDSNAFIEITHPKFSEKIRDIRIYCNQKPDPRFDSKNFTEEFKDIRPFEINNIILKHFTCKKPEVSLSYKPEKKLEVGPNEYVELVTQGESLVIKQNPSINVSPNSLTKVIIFLVAFFISLAAGSVLLIYLEKLGLFCRRTKNRAKPSVQ